MPTLRLALPVQCRQAAESALQDGDEGGFEFQNMLASEITASWLTEGFSWSAALDIVTCSDLESGEDRGARGEIRLPAALAGSQKRGARAGETGFLERANASVPWGVALQHASSCARRSVRSCRCPLRHRRGWDEKREMDQTQLLENLCCALTEAGGVGGFGQAAGHARGPSRPFS